MKPAAMTGLLFLFTAGTVNAQLTLMPQGGIERSNTKMSINESGSFSPTGGETSLKGALKLDYRFRGGHGPYILVGTSPGAVAFNFSDPSTASSNYKALNSSTQLAFEAGYQYRFRILNFKTPTPSKSETTTEKKSSCGSVTYKSHCGTKARSKSPQKMNLNLVPSVGMAYRPSANSDIKNSTGNFQYNAGNWTTAVVPALGIELGKGRSRLMNLTVSYTRGIDPKEQVLNTEENNKPLVTRFNSSSSNWGITLGVPISLIKPQPEKKNQTIQKKTKSNCESYRIQKCYRLQ